jgi:hypothetical protein
VLPYTRYLKAAQQKRGKISFKKKRGKIETKRIIQQQYNLDVTHPCDSLYIPVNMWETARSVL